MIDAAFARRARDFSLHDFDGGVRRQTLHRQSRRRHRAAAFGIASHERNLASFPGSGERVLPNWGTPIKIVRFFLMVTHFVGLALVCLLLSLLRPFDVRNGYRFTQWLSAVGIRLMGVRYELRHAQRLAEVSPAIIVGNHQSNLDMYFYGYLFPPQAVTIGKKSLRWFPFFGWLYYLSGHIFIDRGRKEKAAQTIRETSERLKRDRLSVMLFPEGTRSKGRPIGPFKKGAFHLAVETGYPLVPVAVSSYVKTLDFWRWRAGTVVAEVLEPIPCHGKTTDDISALLEQTREQITRAVARLDVELARV